MTAYGEFIANVQRKAATVLAPARSPALPFVDPALLSLGLFRSPA